MIRSVAVLVIFTSLVAMLVWSYFSAGDHSVITFLTSVSADLELCPPSTLSPHMSPSPQMHTSPELKCASFKQCIDGPC